MATTLDELMEKVTIKFPRHVVPAEMKNILRYVVEKVGNKCSMNYQTHTHYNVSNNHLGDDSGVREGVGTTKIGGSISTYGKDSFATTSFDVLGDYIDDEYLFNGIRFFTAPGYDIDEIDKNELELMDMVRSHINDYFSKREVKLNHNILR